MASADVRQVIVDMVGPDHVSPLFYKRAKDFRYGPSGVLATPMLCLRDAPQYTSARWDPDIDECFYTVVGYDQPEDVERYIRAAHSGWLPEPAAGTWVNSIWDPSQAPEGRHSATGWFFFPMASYYSAQEWEDIRVSYMERFLARWGEFAPNANHDNVVAMKLYTPDQMERKNLMWEGDCLLGDMAPDQMGPNRPWPEAADYRLEIPNLYLCGPSAYPGGGVHAAPGYNAYKVIAEDLALASPVTERGLLTCLMCTPPRWYDAVKEAINARLATLKEVPQDEFTIAVEIVGDGRDTVRRRGRRTPFPDPPRSGPVHLVPHLEEDDPSVKLNYRFTGPGTEFDEIAAGLADPIDAALSGTIKVRGDMRFLMRQAQMVQVLLEAYANDVDTTWPQGRPPYEEAG
ncbi:MAG: hypothetical protein M5U19_21300 [Microthrixaceae bacterium]|nr:hypothetical protein [Microthrixaceae bacterium]